MTIKQGKGVIYEKLYSTANHHSYYTEEAVVRDYFFGGRGFTDYEYDGGFKQGEDACDMLDAVNVPKLRGRTL